MNIQSESNNLTFKPDQIWTNKEHIHVENHMRINNLALIHFNHQRIIMICSKICLVQKTNPRIKTQN
jgi:hypothetical protein